MSVCGSQMIVSPSVQCVPPKNLASSSLQDGFHLADSTWISSVALLAQLVINIIISNIKHDICHVSLILSDRPVTD